jgi:hypothetical protein
MKKRSICTYLELTVPSCLFWTELEPLKVRNPLVICKEAFASTSGFNAATPAFIVAPYLVVPFNFLVTLNPIPNPMVGRAPKERELPILVKIILTFHGIITSITQGREPSKVTVSKQIIGTAYHIPPPQMISFKALIRVIHNVYKGIHKSLQQTTT